MFYIFLWDRKVDVIFEDLIIVNDSCSVEGLIDMDAVIEKLVDYKEYY